MFEILRHVLKERARYLLDWNGAHECLKTIQFGILEGELILKQRAMERSKERR